MAEVLFNIASAIINKLGDGALQEFRQLRGLGNELGKLRGTVRTIHGVLLDAEKLSRTNNEIKQWLSELKDAVYDADDLFDDISTEESRRKHKSGNVVTKEVRCFFSSSNRIAYGLKMAHKVKAIREKLDEIAKNRRDFNLAHNVVEQAFENDRDTHSCAPNVVIGREDDKKKLVSLLLDEHDENVVVIPIVGLGGLGKTTLAQMIYKDEKVEARFDLKVWVCVSDIFDIKSIIEKLIECIDEKRPTENHGMEALKGQLHKRVKGKKCLFVLDDIWNEDMKKWNRLSDLIVCGARESIILVTTRSKFVAEITGTLKPYELKELSQRESWDLFQKVAFKHGQLPNEEFEKLGKEIAEKCCGLPLAIRTIGSYLYTKRKESEWRHFKDKEFSKLDRKVDILDTLKLSYNHLPSNLKHCFAYCSLFPKDYVFCVSRLISYWKAQGYLDDPQNEGTSSQDIGLNCLKYLVQRSFFQIEKENKDGEIVECKMHDFMHDLSILVAGEEVQIRVYGGSNGATVTEKTRHMSLHEVTDEVKQQHVAPLLQGKKARTLIVQNPYAIAYETIGEECLGAILDELRYLRVLSLQGGMFKKLPSFIDKLKHLRQLDLSWSRNIEMLPNSITHLHNLQELNLDGCRSLKKLPRDMKKLVNLIRLGVEWCDNLQEMPLGIGKLTSLEVLSRFVLSNESRRHAAGELDELEKLNMLKGKLKICNLQRVKKGASEVANLKDKPYLRSLTLEWRYSQEVEDSSHEEKSLEALQPHEDLRKLRVGGYRGVRFPEWISSLQNLVKIRIIDCGNCKYLPSLDGLPSLKHMEVHGLQGLEYMIDNSENTIGADTSCFFPSLEKLIVENCLELKGWWSTSTREELLHYQLSRLSQMEIYWCPNLKGWMPELPSLKDLNLICVSAGLLEETLKQAKPPSTSTGTSLSPPPLQSLSILEIKDFHEEALQNIASLDIHFLRINGCEKMTSLPSGIQYLTSLETLEIEDCEELESMPTWVGNLTSLNRLDISSCPKLSEKCGNNQGEDWPSISHIPNIEVDGEPVQLNGSYQL